MATWSFSPPGNYRAEFHRASSARDPHCARRSVVQRALCGPAARCAYGLSFGASSGRGTVNHIEIALMMSLSKYTIRPDS